MNIDKDWLRERIMELVAVIEENIRSTTYANDRYTYLRDMAQAANWLVKLHRGISPSLVASEIISPQTDKDFGDYWRQGEWGENETKALEALQSSIQGYSVIDDRSIESLQHS